MPGIVAQIDELIKLLLTKDYRDFHRFCHICERNGYSYWAQRLRANAAVCKQEAEGTHALILDHMHCFWGAKGAPILFSVLGFSKASCSYDVYMYVCLKVVNCSRKTKNQPPLRSRTQKYHAQV